MKGSTEGEKDLGMKEGKKQQRETGKGGKEQ